MPPNVNADGNRPKPGAVTPRRARKCRNALRHDLSNELAVVTGFSWLALASLRKLSEKLQGDAQSDLQSIISMVERVKSSAEQGRNLLTGPHQPRDLFPSTTA